MPIRHIGQAIYPSYHCDLSHGVAECAVNIVLSAIDEGLDPTLGVAYGFSLPSRAEPSKVSLSHVISGWNGLTLICGHCRGRPKPGTIQPCCFLVAMLKKMRSPRGGVSYECAMESGREISDVHKHMQGGVILCNRFSLFHYSKLQMHDSERVMDL